MPQVFVKFDKIWRYYTPGNFASFEIAGEDDKDPKTGRKVEKLGDRVLRSAAVRVPVEEAVKHLSKKELVKHGYPAADIEKAVKALKPEEQERWERFNTGEAEREAVQKEQARASVRR